MFRGAPQPGTQTRCKGAGCVDNGEDSFKGVCDRKGRDIQPQQIRSPKSFQSSGFKIGSTKSATVATQPSTAEGMDDGIDEGPVDGISLETIDGLVDGLEDGSWLGS